MFKGLMNKIFGNIGMNTVSGGMPANTDRMAGRPNPDEYKTKEAGVKIDDNNATSWNKETHPKGPGPSKLVKEIHYDNRDGDDTLTVQYRDGFTALYDDIDPSLVQQFIASDSKGRYALRHLWKLPYRQA